MKCTITFLAISLLVVAGCGTKEETTIVGADGTKVTASQDGTNISVTDDSGKTTTVNADDKGNMSLSDGKGTDVSIGNSVTEADLGVPFYPGSSENKQGISGKVDTEKETVVTSMRTTKDEPSRVLEFYQKHVMNPKMSNTTGTTKIATISGVLESGPEIAVTANQDGSEDTKITVAVRRKK